MDTERNDLKGGNGYIEEHLGNVGDGDGDGDGVGVDVGSDGEEDGESDPLLPPATAKTKAKGGGGPGRISEKSLKKVQWNDRIGKKLAEVLEYEPSDVSDSDDEDTESCFCNIM